MRLTGYDCYALARALQGLDSDRARCSAAGTALLDRLLPIPTLTDRVRLLSTLVTPSEQQRITLTPTDAPPSAPSLALFDARQLRRLPPPRLLLPGIPEEGLTVLYGESGAGKSFIALNYAIEIATNGLVVYAPTEGLRGYAQRLEAWENHHGASVPNSLYFLASGLSLTDKAAFETLIAQIELWRRGQRLLMVVIDTLAMSMIGADENSSRDMGLALAAIRQLIETLKCAVLLVHHSAKNSVSERGSSALRGNADSMIKVTAYDDVIRLECAKAKDFEPFEQRYYRLKSIDGSAVAVPCDKTEGDKRSMTQLQRHVMEALQLETCQDGVTLRDLSEIVGVPIATLHRSVSRLLKDQYVTRGKRGYTLTDKAVALIDPP